jgi:hypothetical protein
MQALIQQTEDQNRQEAQMLRAGNFVWLSTWNLKSKRPSKKLGVKWVGPHPTAEVVDEVTLTACSSRNQWVEIRDMFHHPLLVLDTGLPLPGQEAHGTAPETLHSPDYDDYWLPTNESNDISNSRTRNKRMEYQIGRPGGFTST